MQFYTDLSWSNPTQVHSLEFPDAVLHGLILKQPYPVSFSQYPDAVLHELILKQPYPGSFSQSLDAVLHGLILRKPYSGSFSWISRCSFTRTHPEATLPRFLLIISICSFTQTPPEATLPRFLLLNFQMHFYTDSSWGSPTQVPSYNFQM